MVDKNIQIKHKNGSTWDKLYPTTTSNNVFDENGISVKTDLHNKADKQTTQIELTKKVDKKQIRINMFNTTRLYSYDCFLLQVGEKNIMIDFSNDGDVNDLQQKILGLGVNKIDIAYITHYHGDHVGGLNRFLTNTNIDFSETQFYVPPIADWSRFVNDPTGGSTREMLQQNEIDARNVITNNTLGYIEMVAGMKIDIDEYTSLTFYNVGEQYWSYYYNAGFNDGSYGTSTDYNDFCIIGLIEQGDLKMVMTGDLAYTAQGLNAKNIPASLDFYQVPHHGLDKIVNPEWAKKIDTKFAFIYNNRDDSSIMSRDEYALLSQRGTKIYNNYLSGDSHYIQTVEGSEVKSKKGLATMGMNQYSLAGGQLIEQNSNLDEYITPGTYVSDRNGRTQSLTGKPDNLLTGFKMQVEYYHHETRMRQTIYEVSGRGYIWYRVFSTNNEWNPWFRVMTDRDFDSGSDDGVVNNKFESGDDMNSFTSVGKYASNTSGLTSTLLNIPSDLAVGFTLEVIPLYDASRLHQVIRVNNGLCDEYTRSYTGEWHPWFKVTKTKV